MAYSQSWSNSTPADPCTVLITPSANDLLIAYCVNDSGTVNDYTPPAGWTELCELQNNTDNQSFIVWYKKSDGTETSIAFDANSGNTGIAACLAFSGINTTTPLDVTSVTFNNNTSATTTDISITPVTNGCDLVFVLGNDRTSSGDTTFTFSTTSGTTGAWTTRSDINSGFLNGAAGSATQTTAGALTARCTTDTAGGRSGILIALRPATVPPVITVQPTNQTVNAGATATFTVTATGATSYQWKLNGSSIGGATSSSYTTGAVAYSDQGAIYTVDCTNTDGTTTSSNALLRVAFNLSGTGSRPYSFLGLGTFGAGAFGERLVGSVSSSVTGTLARTNANDTLAATALAVPNGTLARTNANDTSSAAATTTILSTLARTNANDTSAASATPVSPSSLARTNANDTLAASGNTWPSSTLARTNANDTLAASGSVGSAADGSVAYTNINDTSSAAGNTGILSTLARTNANDTLTASGSPVGGGTLARTNNNDTSAATAISTIVGTSSTTNSNDTLSASGSAGSVPVGNLTYTNNNDTVSSSGSTTILSSLARTNNNDTLAASGSAGSGGSGVTTRLPLTGVGS